MSSYHERPAAVSIWAEHVIPREGLEGVCLVTGERRTIARTHPVVRGVYGGQLGGAPLISVDKDSTAFHSYGKAQGYCSPVSHEVAAADSTALNELLRPNGPNRVQLADASTVF